MARLISAIYIPLRYFISLRPKLKFEPDVKLREEYLQKCHMLRIYMYSVEKMTTKLDG